MFNPGLVYDAGFVDYLGFLCRRRRFCCASAGRPRSDLNYPSIGVVAGRRGRDRHPHHHERRRPHANWTRQGRGAGRLCGHRRAEHHHAGARRVGDVHRHRHQQRCRCDRRVGVRRPHVDRPWRLRGAQPDRGAGHRCSVPRPRSSVSSPTARSPSRWPSGTPARTALRRTASWPNTPTVGVVAQDPDQTPFTDDDDAGRRAWCR